jgi:hypothetical protein
MPLIYINTTLCAALFWTCFCRIVRTDTQTHWPVRLAFVVLASAAAACGVAPWGVLAPCLPASTPGPAQLLITGAMVLVQALTARYWRDGVPCHFQRETRS